MYQAAVKLVSPGSRRRFSWVLLVIAGTVGCDSNDSCVAIGTLITTPTGAIPVEDLRVGDPIYSVAPATGRLCEGTILAVRRGRDSVLTLTTETGRQLRATRRHLVFSPDTARYERVERWTRDRGPSVWVRTAAGVQVERIVRCEEQDEPVDVFDLTVDTPFRNFVASGVLVHNKSKPIEENRDFSEFDTFEFERNSPVLVPGEPPTPDFCPPLDSVYRAVIRALDAGEYDLELWVVDGGRAGVDACAFETLDTDCAVLTTTRRQLEPDEVRGMLDVFSSVFIQEILDESTSTCLANEFRWDDLKATDVRVGSGFRLNADETQKLLEFLESLRPADPGD